MASSYVAPLMLTAPNALSAPTSIEDLTNELLVEILSRLPTYDDAVELKLVSKRWYSQISHPYFVFCFLKKNPTSPTLFTPMILSYFPTKVTNDVDAPERFRKDFVPAETNMIINDAYNLRFLPCHKLREHNPPLSVLATCNNFLLCSEYNSRWDPQPRYYICNALTFQRIYLPKPTGKVRGALLGLKCEPCYERISTRAQDPSVYYKLLVVRVPDPNDSPHDVTSVEIFSSESRQWSEAVVPGGGIRLSCFFTEAVVFNGMFHWLLHERGGIFGMNIGFVEKRDGCREKRDGCRKRRRGCRDKCDGCRDKRAVVLSCHCIPLPPDVAEQVSFEDMSRHILAITFGVSQSFLRMSVLRDSNELNIWELKKYNTGEWSMVHKVYLDNMISRRTPRFELDLYWPRLEVLGFHPNDGDMVYLRARGDLLLCNLRTGYLRLVAGHNNWWRFADVKCFFLISIPRWCTPVPAFSRRKPKRLPPLRMRPGRVSLALNDRLQ